MPEGKVFFRIPDTLRDIRYIDSFFFLVYSNKKYFLIQDIQKFFPSNEEEISWLSSHYKNGSQLKKMEDSIYDNGSNSYRSKFFPALAKEIQATFPRRSQLSIRFGGFDVIDNSTNDPYDTTNVNYEVFINRNTKKMKLVLPYLRDNDFGIQNIYYNNGESVIDSACQGPREEVGDRKRKK
jgi:hypothetical protein